jgi:ferritin-like protein
MDHSGEIVTRAGLLRLGAGAAGVALVAAPALVGAAQSGDRETRALNLLLMIEYTEAAFYTEALQGDALRGELRSFAEVVVDHEKAHLALLKQVLGDKADPEPKHDFGNATGDPKAFAIAAGRLEDVGVAAYNGQAGNVSPEAFAAAARIVSVEARHAAWVRSIVRRDPAPRATDKPMTDAQVRSALEDLGVKL